jgi:AcrR family transcriptional regulator
MTRKYEMRRRAESHEATRHRIVDAAIRLHGSPGSSGASITAIAALAGVSRLTVYRHFPDERALFAACTGAYFEANPPPDPAAWLAIADPMRRLELALRELYAYYSDNEGMATQSEIGAASNPVLAEVLAPFAAGIEHMRDILLVDLADETGPGSILVGAMGHAVAFSTWRSLRREQGLTNAQAVTLMTELVRSLAGRRHAVPAAPEPGSRRARPGS